MRLTSFVACCHPYTNDVSDAVAFVVDASPARIRDALMDRCNSRGRALQALDAAIALDRNLRDPAYAPLRARLRQEVAPA